MSSIVSARAGLAAGGAPRQASGTAGMTASLAASASVAGLSEDLPLFSRLQLDENAEPNAATALLRQALREFGAGAL